jgi:hypothetical protein
MGNALVGAYLNQLGLSQSAVAYITISSPDNMSWLTADDAKQVGIEFELLPGGDEPSTEFGRSEDQPSSPSTPPAASPPRSMFSRLQGADIYGYDLTAKPIAASSAQECEEECSRQPDCKAFTFNSRNSMCYLKSGGSLVLGNPLADSGYRQELEATLRRSTMTVYERTDFPGGDYGEIRDASFEQCLSECERDQRCLAFTYVLRQKQCWLKSSVSSAIPLKSAISGRKMRN